MSNQQNDGTVPSKKRSTTETGNAINLANFNLLIKTVTKFGSSYNPSNEDLTLDNLNNIYDKAKSNLDACTTAETAFDNITGSRSELFKNMKKLSGKAHRSFKASKVMDTAKADAQTIMNKLRGKAGNPKKKDILADGEEAQKTISNSQQSYTQLIEHFKALRELVSSHNQYFPNELELQPNALMDFEVQLNDKNNYVGEAITTWRSTRRVRSKTFYATDTGMIDIAFAVKNYIASIFETTSPEYKEVNKIRFRTIKQ
jgi:hypothetical protein